MPDPGRIRLTAHGARALAALAALDGRGYVRDSHAE
jgi:hypothetical protein